MNADEIRNEYRWDVIDPEYAALMQIQVVAELAAQVATLNEARKPRWVNISSTSDPCLLDATEVVGLKSTHAHNSASEYLPVVYIRLRGMERPHEIWDRDHDEVRALLGIDEDWIQPPAPMHPNYMPIHKGEWDSANKIVALTRAVLAMLPDSKRNELAEAITEFDNHQMPF